MDLLNPVGIRRGRRANRHVGHFGQFVGPLSGQRQHFHTGLARFFDGHHDIARVAARTDREQHVARTSESLDPARENLIETEIVAHAGHISRVVDRHGRQRPAVAAETAGQLLGEMRRVAQRPAVAAAENLVSVFQSGREHIDRLTHPAHRVRIRNERLQHILRLLEALADNIFHCSIHP